MKKLVSSGRLFAFGFIVTALLALCVVTLYKLQIIEGAAYYEESQENQSSLQTVTASRGNILDRYGRVLVSNRECYNLKISDTRLFSDEVEDPNSVILEMVNLIEASGETYTDDLPITQEPPFEYTDMTELQRTLLTAYLKGKGLDEDTTAVELMSYFRTRYDIANSYTAEEMRKIAGVRYAINVRYEINTSSYIFVEDASIDLISDLMGVVGNVVEVETSYIREYSTQYAAHILGYVGSMNEAEVDKYRAGKENSTYDYDTKVGKDGIEYVCEEWLHGTNGQATVTRTSSGTVTNTIYEKDPVPGNHVYLTIDIELQEAVERALESGIYAMQKGECHIAPIHLLDAESGEYNIPYVKKYFPGEKMVLVKGVGRTQGLMLPKGNPHGINTIADIVSGGFRFANRQRGAGTRLLFDYLLAQNGLKAADVDGYAKEYSTHLAVGMAVECGAADVGLGVGSAANCLGLDFVPLYDEEYDFLLREESLDDERVRAFLEFISSDAFRKKLRSFGDYTAKRLGEIVRIC